MTPQRQCLPPRPASAEHKPGPRRSQPRLSADMVCDTAFRMIARQCLEGLTGSHGATCRGSHAALHEMRVALTRLRAAMAFFSPMIVDSASCGLKRDLKWLNGHLGVARDMDVAVERIIAAGKLRPHISRDAPFREASAKRHRELTRVLLSARYRRLVKALSAWIKNGPWSAIASKEKQRVCPIVRYGERKLTRWHEKLLKKAGGLADMGARKRHRLRLASKRLRYSIEFFDGLLSTKSGSMRATLKQLRKAQQSLGELNDAVNGQALLVGLQPGTVRHLALSNRRDKQLMRSAARAYRKMDSLSPLCP